MYNAAHMALREEIEAQGKFIFRWRSYLPLAFLPLFAAALMNAKYLERTYGPDVENLWSVFCLLVSFSGLAVRAMVAGYVPRGTSGRNVEWQAASTLNTTGIYSVVRHPLYLGNFVIFMGIVLFIESWWFALVGVLGFLLYHERIMFTEEEFLRGKFGEPFLQWAAQTPAFFPDFRKWRRPALPFSLKTVLRREYSTFMGMAAAFTFVGILAHLLSEKRLVLRPGWMVFFGASLAIYFTLLTLKKNTHLLDAQGR